MSEQDHSSSFIEFQPLDEAEAWCNMISCIYDFLTSSTNLAAILEANYVSNATAYLTYNPKLLLLPPPPEEEKIPQLLPSPAVEETYLTDFPWFMDLLMEIRDIANSIPINAYYVTVSDDLQAVVVHDQLQECDSTAEPQNLSQPMVSHIDHTKIGDCNEIERALESLYLMEQNFLQSYTQVQDKFYDSNHVLSSQPPSGYDLKECKDLDDGEVLSTSTSKENTVENVASDSSYFEYSDSDETIAMKSKYSSVADIVDQQGSKGNDKAFKNIVNEPKGTEGTDTCAEAIIAQLLEKDRTEGVKSEEIQTVVNKRYNSTLKATMGRSAEQQKPLEEVIPQTLEIPCPSLEVMCAPTAALPEESISVVDKIEPSISVITAKGAKPSGNRIVTQANTFSHDDNDIKKIISKPKTVKRAGKVELPISVTTAENSKISGQRIATQAKTFSYDENGRKELNKLKTVKKVDNQLPVINLGMDLQHKEDTDRFHKQLSKNSGPKVRLPSRAQVQSKGIFGDTKQNTEASVKPIVNTPVKNTQKQTVRNGAKNISVVNGKRSRSKPRQPPPPKELKAINNALEKAKTKVIEMKEADKRGRDVRESSTSKAEKKSESALGRARLHSRNCSRLLQVANYSKNSESTRVSQNPVKDRTSEASRNPPNSSSIPKSSFKSYSTIMSSRLSQRSDQVTQPGSTRNTINSTQSQKVSSYTSKNNYPTEQGQKLKPSSGVTSGAARTSHVLPRNVSGLPSTSNVHSTRLAAVKVGQSVSRDGGSKILRITNGTSMLPPKSKSTARTPAQHTRLADSTSANQSVSKSTRSGARV